jgi:hypothetical protein
LAEGHGDRRGEQHQQSHTGSDPEPFPGAFPMRKIWEATRLKLPVK